MQFKNEKLFTAGQFAQMNNINKRTLMFYDDIDLLKPVYRGENNYRYYSLAQGGILQMLLSLRELDVSIDEIKAYMQKRSPENLMQLLEEKIAQATQEIKKLQNIKQMMTQRKETLQVYTDYPYLQVQEVYCPAQSLYLSDSIANLNEKESLEVLMRHASRCLDTWLFNTGVGSLLHVDNVQKGNFEICDYYFTVMQNKKPIKNVQLHTRPQGTYLRTAHKGKWETLHQAYNRLLQYANEHHLHMKGYSYEFGVVDEMAIESMDDYVTLVEIQVEKT